MNNKWVKLIEMLERNEATPDYVAECIYAYIDNYGDFEDEKLADDLVGFIKELTKP